MAIVNISIYHNMFCCPMCLDLMKDPVAIPCGHSFCKVCINYSWDNEDQNGIYSCPQCADLFTRRPVLGRNNMLAEVVEKLKKTDVQAAYPDHCYSGPGDVECDFCIGRKHKAVMSCLTCLTSLCESHLKPHEEVPGLKRHKLVEVSGNLQEKICSEHDKLLKMYCRTDQSLVCYLCTTDNHKKHDTVSVKAHKGEIQSGLKQEQMKFQQRVQEKQKKVQELKQAVDTIKRSAQTAVEDSERIFTDLIRSMEKKRSEVTKMIRTQEKTEVSRAERLLEQLEQEIYDLQRRVSELEQLSYTHDDIHFIQKFQSLCVSSGCQSPTLDIIVHQHLSFDGVMKPLSDLKKRVEEFCEEEEFDTIPSCVRIFTIPEPQSREDFLKYFCHLTLDPNTVHWKLGLSKNKRAVSFGNVVMENLDHPDRVDNYYQVLSKESLSGRCYWEVEWRDSVKIAISYKDISSNGIDEECRFGTNNRSWCLCCSNVAVAFCRNTIANILLVQPDSRIGVYVDQSAETLSFYNVSDTMELLHRIHTTFTQPLYAGFALRSGSAVRLCDGK